MRPRLALLTVIATLGAACSPSVGQPDLPVGSTTTVETNGTVESVDLTVLTEVLFIDDRTGSHKTYSTSSTGPSYSPRITFSKVSRASDFDS